MIKVKICEKVLGQRLGHGKRIGLTLNQFHFLNLETIIFQVWNIVKSQIYWDLTTCGDSTTMAWYSTGANWPIEGHTTITTRLITSTTIWRNLKPSKIKSMVLMIRL